MNQLEMEQDLHFLHLLVMIKAAKEFISIQ